MRPLPWERTSAEVAVSVERDRQDMLWGEQNHDYFTWLAILQEEIGEASADALTLQFNPDADYTYKEARKSLILNELIQVAAVANAMVESFLRQGYVLA